MLNGEREKKQLRPNSAYTSSGSQRINIHVSISKHCSVIINWFAALSAISLSSSCDFKLTESQQNKLGKENKL